jgi:hypothetical protein
MKERSTSTKQMDKPIEDHASSPVPYPCNKFQCRFGYVINQLFNLTTQQNKQVAFRTMASAFSNKIESKLIKAKIYAPRLRDVTNKYHISSSLV